MKYIFTSKDGIFYQKRLVPDSFELQEGQIEVDRHIYNTVDIPCKLIDGELVTVTEIPKVAYETVESIEVEPELTLKERIAILETENATLSAQLTDMQLALCDVYESFLNVTATEGETNG